MNRCPYCNQEMECSYRDHVNYTLCEEQNDCPEGHYSEYFSYGMYEVGFCDGWERGFSYLTPAEARDKLLREVQDHARSWKFKWFLFWRAVKQSSLFDNAEQF